MKLHELVDTFDDDTNPLLSYAGPATVAGGRLVLPLVEIGKTYPETGAPIPTADVFTQEETHVYEALDFTESSLVLELVEIPTSIRSRVTINLESPDAPMRGEFLGWSITAGVIEAFRYVDQVAATGWSAPFDPVAHRWVKIAHSAGAVIWSTSGDGLEWIDRAQLATGMVATGMRLIISAYLRELENPNDDDGGDPEPALLDNLNTPPPSGLDDPFTTIAGDPYAPNLAIDLRVEEVEGAFVLDEHALDEYAVLGWGANPAGWVNVVCDVTHAQISRGTTGSLGPLVHAEAGTCTVVVRDIERRIDPTINGDVIRPGTPVRVRAWADGWSEILFTGRVGADGIAVVYSQADPPVVTFTASDLIGELVRWESIGYPEPGVGTGDQLLDRVQRVLDEVDIENGLALSPDPEYVVNLGPTKLDNAWRAITAATTAELGRVWVTSGNRLAVRSRGSQLTGPVRGTLSDWHGETIDDAVHCCYTEPSVRYSPEGIVNRAIGQRAAGSGVTVAPAAQLDDEVSQVRHGVHVVRETLNLADDAQVEPWLRSLLSTNTEIRVRVERITPTPWSAPEAWPAVCATDIGDRWHVRIHSQLGPTVREAVGVLGVEHDITPESWSTSWFTAWAPAPGENPSGWFMLDLSTLDGGDVLAPFA